MKLIAYANGHALYWMTDQFAAPGQRRWWLEVEREGRLYGFWRPSHAVRLGRDLMPLPRQAPHRRVA